MPKGKTNAPLYIQVYGPWMKQPAVVSLIEAGHHVWDSGQHDVGEPDWIMHPAAGWSAVFFARDDKGNYPFVAARLKAERARKKAGK